MIANVAVLPVLPVPVSVLVKAMSALYPPGARLPTSLRERVTVTGVAVTVPEVKLAFSQGGMPEIAKLRLPLVALS